MDEMFGILKELTASRTLEKVVVREEARHPITKHGNAISIIKMEKEKNVEKNEVVDKSVIELSELNAIEPKEVVDIKKEVEDGTHNQPGKSVEEETTRDGIKELVEMPRYNDTLLATRLGKMDYEANNSFPVGPMYNAILKKKITNTCNVGGFKYMDALVDQGSDVNIMPLSIYNRLTSEKPIDGYVYPVDFVILEVKEDKKKPSF
ncbi:hypothetical protein Tco_0806645 [Tanacetum coccineum]